MRDGFLGLNRLGRPEQAGPETPAVAVSAAMAMAQEHWAEAMGARLTSWDEADREVVSAQAQDAAIRAGQDFTARFAARVFSSAFWSGLAFAAVIGVVLWAGRIPSRHGPAATTAAAYLVMALVAAQPFRSELRRILGNLELISVAAGRNFLRLYIPALAAAAVLYCLTSISAFNSAARPHVSAIFYVQEFGAYVAVAVLGFLVSYLALAYGHAYALGSQSPNATIMWAGTLAATAVTAWWPGTRLPSPGNRYLDSGVLRLLGCTVTMGDLSRAAALPDARVVKSVILDLELAAAAVEQYAVSRVPRTDTATRRLARLDGLRLARVIRGTKAAVAGAIHPRDYAVPAGTLAGFLLAWARPGQPGPAEPASDAPPAPGQSWWRRLLPRLWSAVLLAAGGTFLPLLPFYDNDRAAAAGLRYALLTAAILALTAQGSPAADIIQRNLERSLPGQGGSLASPGKWPGPTTSRLIACWGPGSSYCRGVAFPPVTSGSEQADESRADCPGPWLAVLASPLC